MKLVINKCFGGFGLSEKAVMHYAKLKGLKLYVYFDESAARIYGPEYRKKSMVRHYCTAPIPGLEGDVYHDGAESDFLNEHYFSERSIERTDPLLVQTVRKLGKAANGQCAELAIVEIPDGVEYEIDEYDGNEHVAEVHRTWR